MTRIEPQIRVRHKNSNRFGTTCPDFLSCCSQEETPIVWDGETAFTGVETSELEILGQENANPDPAKCGAGKGPDCCIFLTAGPNGFCCDRFSQMRFVLLFSSDQMFAKRIPTEPYPSCMNQGD